MIPVLNNGSIPNPASITNAFYAFDNNTLDLYSARNGEVVGGSVNYIQGYVAYGQAIGLNQSIATQINIKPSFNLTVNSNFTIEGFFMLQNAQMNAILVQLTSTIIMSLSNGILSASLGSNFTLTGTTVIELNLWHHLSFVYDAIQQIATISLDGIVEATQSSIKLEFPSNNITSAIIVGAGFQGYIDQLSILLEAKSQDQILWDATVAGYYPLDTSWLLDSGPNGNNASAANVISIFGWRGNALNFNISGSYFQANGFTALGTPNHAFSVTVWVRSETQPGVFLTVANSYTCLLVLGLQNGNNQLVAYLPNATAVGSSVNIIGPSMPSNAWVHVAFTWSPKNRARLYTSAILQGSSNDANTLNNVRGGNNSAPMTVTLGKYNGVANCQGIQGINTTQQFMGSLDELFVFSRELQDNDLQKLSHPY